jgi:dihydrofolate synthase / folylpolyglutamate synthase
MEEQDQKIYPAPSVQFRERVDELYQRMGKIPINKHGMRYVSWYYQNPEKEYKIIHVAGTNGKGSVCAKLQELLKHSKCLIS